MGSLGVLAWGDLGEAVGRWGAMVTESGARPASGPAKRGRGGGGLELAVEQAVLDGFGEVVFGDFFGAFEVGDGSGDAADLVVGAGAEA